MPRHHVPCGLPVARLEVLPLTRAPASTDLYPLRVPTDVVVSPDGRFAAFSVKSSARTKDSYRQALWLAPTDGSAPARQLTLGVKNDTAPRWSPDGRTLAFLSDRGPILEPPPADMQPAPGTPSDAVQVWLLPVAGGEARQLTHLAADVSQIAWSPDGRRLCVVSSAKQAERDRDRRGPDDPPRPDARIIDRLQYQLNGVGFTFDRPNNLWLVDVEDGAVRRLTRGRSADEDPRWSPDGRTIAFVSNRHPDADLGWRTDVYLLDVESGAVRRLTGGRGERSFAQPSWSPDGAWIAAVGHRYPAGDASSPLVWRFQAGDAEAEGEALTGPELMVGAAMNSDLFGGGDVRPLWSGDGRAIVFSAPVDGSYEAWRVDVESRRVERLTRDEHYLSRLDAVPVSDGGGAMVAAGIRVSGTEPPDVVTFSVPVEPVADGERVEVRRLSDLMGDAWRDVQPVQPVTRWHEVDGRRIQGWFLEAPRVDGRPAPLIVEIHGGPATLYGWSLFWEWQCMVAAGMSVYACNPRGSQGYGQDFAHANFRDWGEGPMRDVMGGVDSLIADGLVDGDRLGVTGGSYGGYLTSWIVGHTDRFRAAASCRSVNDMTSQMLSGDIGGPTFGRFEYGSSPWEDPELFRQHSPLTYAERIHTPLLIQHAEKDLRTPITQAEELFSVLRSLKRPVRLMRVPEESHELTRSGAPFRRVENIERIRDWFRYYLVEDGKGLPPT